MLLLVSGTLSVGLVGLLAGLHLTGHVVLNPPLRSLDFGAYLAMKRELDHAAPKLAKPLMLAGLGVSALALAVALVSARPDVAIAFAVTSSALIVTLVAILRGDLPINRAMAEWDEAIPPSGWTEVRRRWEGFFLVRVVTTAVALIAALIGVAVIGGPG